MAGRHVEELTRFRDNFGAVGHRDHGTSFEDEADVLDLAETLSACGANVLRPFPARLVRCPSEDHRPDSEDLEATLLELTDLPRTIEVDQPQIHPFLLKPVANPLHTS